jgi:hypothetical protein
MQALGGATVRVEYPGMLATDSITVSWSGVAGAGSPAPASKQGDPGGRVLFDIPATAVGANLGRTVVVTYTVTRTTEVLQSEVLSLNIATLPASQISNKITVEKESNGTLDVTRAPNGVDLTIPAWPFIASGQRVWLRLDGKKADGSLHTLTFWAAAIVNYAEVNQGFLRKAAPATYLSQLVDGGTFTVTFKVAFSGSDETQALAYPVKALKILNSANPPG